MARSHAIWLLTYGRNNYPSAAFTVKHELVTYLDRNRWQWDQLRLFRMVDSPHPVKAYREEPTVTELDIRELMRLGGQACITTYTASYRGFTITARRSLNGATEPG